MARKLRLDLQLLTKGLVSSRQEAQQLIRAGKVSDLKGQILDKPGTLVSEDLQFAIKERPRFVSRGGIKLLGAFENFNLNVEDRICLDGGISTGGFTDCLLQHGARKVYGIDVGYGQTAWTIRNDARVSLKERTNIRTLLPNELYDTQDLRPDFAVADLSFISLRLVLPSLKTLLRLGNSELVLLVKPQFEVGRDRVGKGGVVKDPDAHVDAIQSVINSALIQGWQTKGLIPSSLKGPAGNQEYLLWLGESNGIQIESIKSLVKESLY